MYVFTMCVFAVIRQVCDCQHQFARWEDGQQRDMPCFRGSTGPELTRKLLKIETSFQHGLQSLRSFGKGILDVKNPTWSKEFNRLVCYFSNVQARAEAVTIGEL